jgi:phenylalanyl-tRNA synthetase beta chain
MLISLEWLKEYVEINEDVKELENALTMIGQEVEAIEEQRQRSGRAYCRIWSAS